MAGVQFRLHLWPIAPRPVAAMLANIFAMNLQTIIRLVGLAGFIAISILIWRFGRKSGWQIRAILHGWACLFSWELLCSALVPMWVADYVDRDMRKALFSGGRLRRRSVRSSDSLRRLVLALHSSSVRQSPESQFT